MKEIINKSYKCDHCSYHVDEDVKSLLEWHESQCHECPNCKDMTVTRLICSVCEIEFCEECAFEKPDPSTDGQSPMFACPLCSPPAVYNGQTYIDYLARK